MDMAKGGAGGDWVRRVNRVQGKATAIGIGQRSPPLAMIRLSHFTLRVA